MFDRAYCVTLQRRPDRWERFQASLPDPLPFPEVERFNAIDGKTCKPGAWWGQQGRGAWGCYQSHLSIIQRALNEDLGNILIFEDDAVFCEDFTERYEAFINNIPSDWDMLYLGGQHLYAKQKPPIRIAEHVQMPYNVNRTHAYAISKKFLPRIYKLLHETRTWQPNHHIDHHYGTLVQKRNNRIYSPTEWLVGQDENDSDIAGKRFETRYWPGGEELGGLMAPFILVLGTHSSGSSMTAMVLHKLGIHMGNQFAYRSDSGEAIYLAKLCEEVMPFPSTKVLERQAFQTKLSKWIHTKCEEAARKDTAAGAKYPHLCMFAEEILQICGAENLYVVNCERDLEESIASLQRREPNRDADQVAAVQTALYTAKREFLSAHQDLRVHTCDYSDMLADPTHEIAELTDFLQLNPSQRQRAQAVLHVNPARRHVNLEKMAKRTPPEGADLGLEKSEERGVQG